MDNGRELAAFCNQLGRQTHGDKSAAKDWFEAFSRLEEALDDTGRTVVLLDEISWMGRYDVAFAGELKQAWDNWFSTHPNTIVFLCGSVSAWIDKNILKSKAFVGRPSMNLTLRELPLTVCSAFWGRGSDKIATREIIDVLSVTGGVPEYLENINPAISADENVRNLCYRPGALLAGEFEDLFNDALDTGLALKRRILHALIDSPLGIKEIAGKVDVECNGHLSANLAELEIAGFVAKDLGINPATGKKTNIFKYRICDNYTRFYLKYIEPNLTAIEKDVYRFIALEQLPGWDAILGLQFENLVIGNVDLLLTEIGLGKSLVYSASPYRQNQTARMKGCQIDLLIQTRKSVYLVEIKRRRYVGEEVVEEVEQKVAALKIPRTKSVRTVLVYEGELSRRVPADAAFSFIVPIETMLGRR